MSIVICIIYLLFLRGGKMDKVVYDDENNKRKFVTKSGNVVEFLFFSDIVKILGISPRKLDRIIEKGDFPKPSFISTSRFWEKDEIENYIFKKMAER